MSALLHQRIEARAAAAPDAIALECDGRSLTYRELDARSNQLARYLRKRGVHGEARVGVCLTRSIDMVVALLAIMKAGGAYVALDPAYPKSRLEFMRNDARVSLVLTHGALRERVPGEALELDSAWSAIETEAKDGLARPASPDALVYVMYTSGSTGTPKGVLVTLGALTNVIVDMAGRLELSPEDSVLLLTALSFDISGLEIYAPLVAGARCLVAPHAMAPDEVRHRLETWRPTVVQATPSVWRVLLPARAPKMLTGGEALTPDLAERLAGAGSVLWNVYGPTETTIWSSAAKITSASDISIGRAIAGTELHVLDDDLRPVPQGSAGELCIGGVGVARGYMGRPDLTAERFVPDPFARRGARLYRTGDLVRARADGSLEFLGRGDTQVKVRGHRIELGEIEAALCMLPGIEHAAAVVTEHTPGDKRIVAYWTGSADPEALRRALDASLPRHMVPSAFVRLPALPRLPSGKLDRKALTAVQGPHRVASEPPRTPVEATLARLWEAALRVDVVGRDDDFFELGGDSLLAARIAAEASRLGLDLSMTVLLEHPRLSKLAEVLGSVEGLPPAAVPAVKRPEVTTREGQGTTRVWLFGDANDLRCSRPVHVMATPLTEDLPLHAFEVAASAAVDRVLDTQPQGPYVLCATSTLSGWLAFDIACRLTVAGERVALLALMNVRAPKGLGFFGSWGTPRVSHYAPSWRYPGRVVATERGWQRFATVEPVAAERTLSDVLAELP